MEITEATETKYVLCGGHVFSISEILPCLFSQDPQNRWEHRYVSVQSEATICNLS